MGWKPDLVSVGKALGSGVPVAAALVSGEGSGAIAAGDHGTTYGGNLLSCRAALFFLEQLMDHGLLEHVRDAGAHFERQLRTLALKHPVIEEVRGAGLMRGLQLTIDATAIVDGARDRGLIVNRTSEKVVRMLPPLNIDKAISIAPWRFSTRCSRPCRRRCRREHVGGFGFFDRDGDRRRDRARRFHRGGTALRHQGQAGRARPVRARGARAAAAAGLFTTNLAQAAPVTVSKRHLDVSLGRARAVVVNSGCANACTGEDGLLNARQMTVEVAAALGCPVEQVLVASTGVIGVGLKMDKVVPGIRQSAANLDRGHGGVMARAIMTTDPFPRSTPSR